MSKQVRAQLISIQFFPIWCRHLNSMLLLVQGFTYLNNMGVNSLPESSGMTLLLSLFWRTLFVLLIFFEKCEMKWMKDTGSWDAIAHLAVLSNQCVCRLNMFCFDDAEHVVISHGNYQITIMIWRYMKLGHHLIHASTFFYSWLGWLFRSEVVLEHRSRPFMF